MRTRAGQLWGRNPLLYAEVVRWLIALLVIFGVNITTEQSAVLMAFTSSLLALATGAYVTTNTPRHQHVKPRRD